MKNKNIGLALGGGAVLGSAHIGVLKAIEEYEINISAVSGTSIGAIIGALYAFGKSADEIKEIALDIKWSKLSSLTLSRMGVLSNEKVGKIITDNIGDVDFEDAKIPFSVVATDISTGKRVVLDKGSVKDAVMASSCIPGMFIPVEIEDQLLVDGGLVENVPSKAIKEFDIDKSICINLNAKHSYRKPKGVVEVLLNTFDIMVNRLTDVQLEDADIVIQPDLSKYNVLNTSQIKDLIEVGYKAAKEDLKEKL
jgi:NTE family protein